MPTSSSVIRRTVSVALLATALLGCSSDGDDDSAADTTAVAADETTTTGAPDDADETTTTTEAAPADDEGGGGASCPVSADAVSGAIGATVVDGDDGQMELLIPDANIRSRADALCMFSADGGFTPPIVLIVASDDPEAQAAVSSILQGNDPQPVAGVGDQASADGGELIFQDGDTWAAVLVTVSGDPVADQEAAIAVAHLIGG